MLAQEETLLEKKKDHQKWWKDLLKEMRKLGLLTARDPVFKTIPSESSMLSALKGDKVIVVFQKTNAKRLETSLPSIGYSYSGSSLRFVSNDTDRIAKISDYIIELHSN